MDLPKFYQCFKCRIGSTFLLKCLLIGVTIVFIDELDGVRSQTIYPDGGRNVIPLVNNRYNKKPSRHTPYNDGTVMAHVIGSAGMNFLYYFHILGVSCENADPVFYKSIQADFAFCLNKIGPLPSQIKNMHLGSIPKPCQDWKLHKPCYKNLADDYDECLINRPGLARKGNDALKFTQAYAKFICGNMDDTQAHLLDRYTKHDLIVDGVFQCFPHLQDRIVSCVKRDKMSKTLCGKFYIVHACFGKYYNADNCHDDQPIYYMDDLFRNMSATLNCPKDGDQWLHPTGPPPHNPRPQTTKGWGWSHARENPAERENPYPGEMGRPWSSQRGEPFIRNQYDENENHNHNQYQYHQQPRYQYKSNQRFENDRQGQGRGSSRVVSHGSRPLPDTSWNNDKPWVDVLDRGTSGHGSPWEPIRYPNQIDRGTQSSRGQTSHYVSQQTTSRRGPSDNGGSYPYSEQYNSQRGPGGGYQTVTLPPAGFAKTRVTHDTSSDSELFSVSSTPSDSDSTDEPGYNFFSFE